MNKINFDKEMQELLKAGAGKRLLLHSCCAPCSSYCLEEVAPRIQTTVFYYNPNLDSKEEYAKRKAEQIRLLRETGLADFLDCDFSQEEYIRAIAGLEDEPEGGARCKVCFHLRLQKTAQMAREGGYDYFATTLTVSPLKNADCINEIGYALEREYGVKYLPSDFKKRGGYLRSIELSKAHHLYRQNYCGCTFSKRGERKSHDLPEKNP
ncbi:MAG: epoxyqueuosine reductase QueH [Clostridia bacterium]|nr:epoxyqueuosine reductase QueH [Clostridia bacterium]